MSDENEEVPVLGIDECPCGECGGVRVFILNPMIGDDGTVNAVLPEKDIDGLIEWLREHQKAMELRKPRKRHER